MLEAMISPKCPICRQYVERLLYEFTGSGERAVVQKMRAAHPYWFAQQGMCDRCLYLNEFETVDGDHFAPDPGFSTLSGGAAVKSTLFRSRVKNEFALLPTHLRLNADPRFRGRGITIAFIDSGFFPHPDLAKPKSRIRRIVDVTDEQFPRKYFAEPHVESWHGMMTSVAAAGNGYLSKGLYRGIASEADVVLIKVMDTSKHWINTQNITRGIRWAIENAEKYNIRIISLSVADDEPSPLRESPVDQAVEEAVQRGIVVVAAVGNNPTKPILPPASSPSAITVGGLDDQNEVWKNYRRMFHSTFGRTVDGFTKPELIAPAIWVAGPILPKDAQFRESAILFKLLNASQREAERIFTAQRDRLPHAPLSIAKGDYKTWARVRIEEMKYISTYYKHVDGTSFAAPIVSSVIAQMLEAHPYLNPLEVKAILIETAEPIHAVSLEQQGHGVLVPRAAVERALKKRHDMFKAGVHAVDERLLFAYHNRVPRSVAVAGSFNNWDMNAARLDESPDGWWSVWLPKPKPGVHQYKYVIDGAVWSEDPANAHKEPDGSGGWNSTIKI
jgi:serine protease AprX